MKALFSENFKPLVIQCGAEIEPDESKLEFIYDSESKPCRATCIGIARRLRIKGNKAMNYSQLLDAIDEKLSTLKQLEKSKMSKNEKINDLVKVAFEDGKTEDEIIVSIVQSGVGYKDALKVYETACIELGFHAKPMKPADRNNKVAELLIGMDFNPKTWDDVVNAINTCLEDDAFKGQSAGPILTSIRAYAKDHELDLPKKKATPKDRNANLVEAAHWIMANYEEATDEEVTKVCEAKKVAKGRIPVFLSFKKALASFDPDVEYSAEGPAEEPKQEKKTKPTKSTMKKAGKKK